MPEMDLSQVESVLKTEYTPEMEKLFAFENILFETIKEGGYTVKGDGLIIPLKTKPLVAGGPGGEKTPIPVAGAPEYERLRFWPSVYRYPFLAWNLTRLLSEGPASFIDALQEQFDGVMEWGKHELARDMYWGRHHGVATCASVAQPGGPGTTVTLTLRNTYTVGGKDLANARGSRYLIENMRCNIINPATGGKRAGASGNTIWLISSWVSIATVQIVSLDAAGAQTLEVPVNLATGDIVIAENGWNQGASPETQSNPIGHQIIGFNEIATNGTDVRAELIASYGLFDRSTLPAMQSVVQDKGGVALTRPDLRKIVQAAQAKSGVKFRPGGAVFCHDSVMAIFEGFVAAGVQYAPRSAPLGMPNRAISFNYGDGEFTFINDDLCPPNAILGMQLDHIRRATVKNFGFDTSSGGILKQYSSGGNLYDAVTGFMSIVLQVICARTNCHWKIADIDTANIDDQYGQGASFFYLR